MARIKSFLGAFVSSSQSQKTESEKIEESNRDKNRNNRNRNRNRNERNKNAAQERPNRNNEAKPQEAKLQDQRQHKPQQARGEQTRNEKPRNNNQQTKAIQTTSEQALTGAEIYSVEPTSAEQTTERSSSRRNRNNRRGRRDRVENNVGEANRPFIPNDEVTINQPSANAETVTIPTNTDSDQQKVAEQITANIESSVEPSSSKTPKTKADNRRQKSPKASVANADVAKLGTNDAAQPAVIIPTNTDSSAAVKADKKRPARTRKPKTETKPVDLATVGLQLVETKADVTKVATPVETEKPRAPRKAASWQKNAKDEAIAEPMVIVETQNK